ELNRKGIAHAWLKPYRESFSAKNLLEQAENRENASVRGNVQHTAENAQDAQDQQRDNHHPRAFRCVVSGFRARLTEEDHLDLPPHIERGERGRNQEETQDDIT